VLVDENAQNSLKSLTMPQESESTGYLRLETVPPENSSLILSFTLSRRIARLTETSPFLSPLLKAKFRHCSQSKRANSLLSFSALSTHSPLSPAIGLKALNAASILIVGDLLQLRKAKRQRLKQFQWLQSSSARKQES